MHPEIAMKCGTVLIATVASFAFGAVYYGAIFSKTYQKLLGVSPDRKPSNQEMIRSLGMNFVGTLLTAYVMLYCTNVWRASVWHAGVDMEFYKYGFYSGFFTWIGFYVPMQLNAVAFENRSWKLFALHTVHSFFHLQIIGMIVAHGCC